MITATKGVVRGVTGHIKWGYFKAADVTGFSIRPHQMKSGHWSLTATIPLADAFKMSQRPLVFTTQIKSKETKPDGSVWEQDVEWKWPIDVYDVRDGHLTATLGKVETNPIGRARQVTIPRKDARLWLHGSDGPNRYGSRSRTVIGSSLKST